MESGSGTAPAFWAEGARLEPNKLINSPGAYASLKDAPLAAAATTGVTPMRVEAVPVTCTVALCVDPDAEYVAVMVPAPAGNCEPVTARVAVAVPAEPARGAVPSAAPLAVNVTVPEGVAP